MQTIKVKIKKTGRIGYLLPLPILDTATKPRQGYRDILLPYNAGELVGRKMCNDKVAHIQRVHQSNFAPLLEAPKIQ